MHAHISSGLWPFAREEKPGVSVCKITLSSYFSLRYLYLDIVNYAVGIQRRCNMCKLLRFAPNVFFYTNKYTSIFNLILCIVFFLQNCQRMFIVKIKRNSLNYLFKIFQRSLYLTAHEISKSLVNIYHDCSWTVKEKIFRISVKVCKALW